MRDFASQSARTSFARSYIQFGFAAEIGGDGDSTNAVRGAKVEILRWVHRAVGLGRPNFVDVDRSFENNDRPGVKYGVAIGENSWVARVEHSDREIHSRYWTTEVCVVNQSDGAMLGVRNVCTSGPEVNAEIPISTPTFVKFFAKRIGLLDAEIEIADDAWLIEDEVDLDELRDLVLSTERFLPVILLTQPYRIDVAEFARRAVGVAHIVAMPDEFTRSWAEMVGKEMSAYFGAIRTYNPDVDLQSRSPFDHPMTLGGKVTTFIGPDGSVGGDAYSDWLLRKAYRVGANRILRDARFPKFSELRSANLDAQRRQASGSDTPLLLEIAEKEIAEYKTRATEAEQLENEALRENEGLNETVGRLHVQNLSMQARLEQLMAAVTEGGAREAEIPDDLSDLKDWADRNVAGRVFILPRAIRESQDSEYERAPDIYNALLWLAHYYWPSKTADEQNDQLREAARDRLAELGLEYAASIDRRNAGGEYYASYGGTRRFMNMALKKGNSREPRYCMRIYTFWDEDAQATIVGSLPKHLDNTLS